MEHGGIARRCPRAFAGATARPHHSRFGGRFFLPSSGLFNQPPSIHAAVHRATFSHEIPPPAVSMWMKRRDFLGKVAAGAAAGAAGISTAAAETKPTKTSLLVRTPASVMAPRADGVEIVWAVSQLARGTVEWKSADGETGVAAADRFGFVPQGDEILRVRLTGLKPGTVYQFRAITRASEGDAIETGSWKSFRTLDPAAATTEFVVWNDTHEHAETLRKLHAATPRGDFLLWNGDTCNNWMREDLLVPTLLHPAGQDITVDRPLLMTWGNHDVRGIWAYKMPEIVATLNGLPYYAFRSGPVAVICLHTGEDKPDHHPSFGGRVAFDPLRLEQSTWLAETIRRPEFRDAPYRIVFCHIPLRWKVEKSLTAADYAGTAYDRFSRRSRDAWHDSLVAWNTQVVISGHTHEAAYLPANVELPYAQLVGGGPELTTATWIEGKANGDALRLVVKNLQGETTHYAEFPPLAG